jgi:hypothetical protein
VVAAVSPVLGAGVSPPPPQAVNEAIKAKLATARAIVCNFEVIIRDSPLPLFEYPTILFMELIALDFFWTTDF